MTINLLFICLLCVPSLIYLLEGSYDYALEVLSQICANWVRPPIFLDIDFFNQKIYIYTNIYI